MYSNFIKPILDFVVAGIVFVIFLPLFLLVIIVLGISNSGSPFFVQLRPGKNSQIFKIVKFKTMNDKRNAAGELLPDDKRLTPIGKIIRKTSLDEIPQLLNVLKGDMSFVGPRPLLPEYLELYSEEQARRHELKPGITGWAQINGRNALSWEEKFKFDVWYVDHQSFFLDLKIIFKTIKKVLVTEGISQKGQTTATKFKG